MSIHACILTSLLFGAAPLPTEDTAPIPKLEKGLEITWRGTFSEEILRKNVRASRLYDVETRVFVWDVSVYGADIALFTSIKLRKRITSDPDVPAIVRLEIARVDPRGKLSLLTSNALIELPDKRTTMPMPLLPMEGLPTLEPRLFVEFPTSKMKVDQAWDIAEDKRPSSTFKIESFGVLKDTRLCKIHVKQQTSDWENERIEQAAWRRTETIWISVKHGVASKLERTIEKRDQQSGELAFKSKLSYEQAGGYSRYSERFGEDRRQEIMAAVQFSAMFEQLLSEAGRHGDKTFDQLLQRIDYHIIQHVPGESAPYRQVILSVQRKAEAAKRGHIPPAPQPPETVESSGLVLGKIAPDITLTNLTNNEATRLSKLRSRPAVLLYYQTASSRTAEPVLQFAERLYVQYGTKAFILPMAIGGNDAALQQRNELKLTVNVLAGREVYRVHGIQAAPCFVAVDDLGVVRKVTLGWSEENCTAIRDELEKWLK